MPEQDNEPDELSSEIKPDAKKSEDESENALPVSSEGKGRDLAKMGFVRSYIELVRSILITPKRFFNELMPQGGFTQPWVFLCVSASIYAVLQAIALVNPFAMITLFIRSIVSVLVASFFLNLILSKMGGKGTFKTTFQVIAYSKAVLLFAWFSLGPFPIGGIASLIYGVYLNILGLEKIHELDRKKVAAVTIGLALLGFAIGKITHL